ncbi:hypothetical protein ACIG87_02945 [Micromonospora sp. NPDC051925]|uniref:hypothetical protein n=1 Tax=Micromonospora sp. NPDC051925 TaxID=3364288 RepID=UPI0037CBD4D9
MSDIDSRAFFGAVLKAVACTRNHNTDETGYAEGVLTPTARIREFEKEIGDRALTQAEVEQVLGWLDSTFRAKLTPAEEREHYHRCIAEVAGVTRAPATVAA